MSLKVAALVTILGAVVLAAEQQLTTVIPPEPAAMGARESAMDRDARQAGDHVPAPSPASSGPVADHPPAY
jgi:hypothetical protein